MIVCELKVQKLNLWKTKYVVDKNDAASAGGFLENRGSMPHLSWMLLFLVVYKLYKFKYLIRGLTFSNEGYRPAKIF
jgi:hypothetical protein